MRQRPAARFSIFSSARTAAPVRLVAPTGYGRAVVELNTLREGRRLVCVRGRLGGLPSDAGHALSAEEGGHLGGDAAVGTSAAA